jgi:hypothetical protein
MKKTRQTKGRAFSSEVDAGSREENASNKKTERFRAKWMPVRVKKTRQQKEERFQAKWMPVRARKTRQSETQSRIGSGSVNRHQLQTRARPM